MSDPKVSVNATITVRDPTPSSSNAIETTKRIIIVRIAQLIRRGDGKSAFTAPSKTAREKKLAPKRPKNKMNSAAKSLGRNPKKLVTCCSIPTTPRTLIPSRMNPSHATQKTKRLTSSVNDGNAAPLSNCVAPVCSESLSKRAIFRTLRNRVRKMKAMTQPITTMNSISRNRGRKRAKLLKISSMGLAASATKFCHIQTSLPAVPQLKQVRLMAFERLGRGLDVDFELLSGSFKVILPRVDGHP